jgi:transposase
MKTILSKKQRFFNQINLTKDDDLHIGIDVHKANYHVALYLNEAHAIDFITPADNTKLCASLKKLQPAIKNIVYEAGPTGYSLARQLQQQSLPVQVIAPSKTPQCSARNSKTDRLDGRKLAEYAAKGLLRPIAIPTRRQEAHRQLPRLRLQFVKKLKQTKLQIKSLLLQYGIGEPQGLQHWSQLAVGKLKTLQLLDPIRYSLDMLIYEYEFLSAKIKDIEQKLNETFTKKPYAKKIAILQSHPGVGVVTSMMFAAEIFNPKRFKNTAQLAKYVGFAPTIIQSGQTLRDGPITKTGRPQLRSILIQAAWIWIAHDHKAKQVYLRIVHNTGQKNKAITAMARRLAIHLWKMLCNNEPYRKTA